MQADFRLSAKNFYSVVDAIGKNYDGLYAALVAGWDIEQYCKNMGYQKRHVILRIENVRKFLEAARAKPNSN